ncbi:MAG: hypothetical protein KDA96_12970 [Planctomycetaceae bacterium]|nr:hypothetical protein [Planctomycetaceae bacterium]
MIQPSSAHNRILRVSPDSADPESVLRQALERQEHAFRDAVAVMSKLKDDMNSSDVHATGLIDRLQQTLAQVISAQSGVQEAQQRFQLSGQQVSTELRTVLKEQEQTLRQMLTCIQETQVQLEAARNVLIPGIERESRRRSMHAAYQQSMRTL